MVSLPGASATPTLTHVDIRRLPWVSRLMADYVFDFNAVAPFYAGNPASAAAWDDRIAAVRAHPRDREALCGVLAAQQSRRHAPAAAVSAAAGLTDRAAVAVVTGQQAGLFGGPLYTLLKALTAVACATRVRDEHAVPAVAVFWVEAEDHDWDEVKSCGVLDADAQLASVSVDDPPGANTRPVASLILDASAAHAVDTLAAQLPPSDSTAWLVEALRDAYQPGRSMSDAFARWLETVLGPLGLIVYDASDPAAKPLAAALFAAELEHAGRTSRLALDAATRLVAAGYPAPVSPVEGSAALFALDGGRTLIRTDGDDCVAGAVREPRAVMAARARQSPEQFSPSVLLRPLVQDTLFPTVCYVAGPTELAYLGQLKDVYAAFGVPMPLVQPRASATLLDANAARFLSRADLPLAALQPRDEAALNLLLGASLPPAVERAADDAERTLAVCMDALAVAVAEVDATLDGATRSALGRMQDDLKKLRAKVLQAAKRKDETLRRQFSRAQSQAFPDGHPQERAVGFVSFLNRSGPSLVDRLRAEVPLTDPSHHWVLTL